VGNAFALSIMSIARLFAGAAGLWTTLGQVGRQPNTRSV
jgi:hypothetical protein